MNTSSTPSIPKFQIGQKVFLITNIFTPLLISGEVEKIYEKKYTDKSIFEYAINKGGKNYHSQERDIFCSKEEAERTAKEKLLRNLRSAVNKKI